MTYTGPANDGCIIRLAKLMQGFIMGRPNNGFMEFNVKPTTPRLNNDVKNI